MSQTCCRFGGGRESVRNVLFAVPVVAARHNPILRRFRDKPVAAGKPKLVAVIALARKLLIILNAILRDRLTTKTVALSARGER